MCGIFGIVSPQPLAEPRPLLEALTDRLSHRGPDGRGSFMAERVFLGHRRLSIMDPAGGAQPMRAAGGRYTLVYNGEVYDFRRLRERLESLGHRFRTDCDTEVVLRSYVEWGAGCVDRFNGMFAFAVWDAFEGELFLARDRLGIKPLYFATLGRRLVFASEMKAIVGHPEFVRQADLQSLSSYLGFRTVVGDGTVFVGLRTLPPGHHLRWKNGATTLREYWDVPVLPVKEDLGEAHYLRAVGETLTRAVERRLMADVPVGAYLSGGLDSSLVVAIMAQLRRDPVRTFSIGFEGEGYDEGEHARAVADHCGTRHKHLVMPAAEYAASLERLVRHRDQPLSIPHEVALYRLSLEVKKDVGVCISGEGADELFGGYGRVQRSPMDYRKVRCFQALPAPLRASIARLVHDPDLRRRMDLRDEVAHFLHVYRWWDRDSKRRVLSGDLWAAVDGDRPLDELFARLFARTAGCDPYDRVLYVFEKVHLPNLLTRLDAQSMAASVEARVPFVDHELVELVSAIPIHYKLRWKSALHRFGAIVVNSDRASERLDTTKYLLRRLAGGCLPAAIARRRKLGFPVPLDSWYGGWLGRSAREVLLDPRTLARGIFDAAGVADLLARPERLSWDFYGKRVWMLMNVELWFRQHIDQTPSYRELM